MKTSAIKGLEKQIEDLYKEQEYQEEKLLRAIEAGKTHVYEVGYSHSWMEYTSIANSERSARERIKEIGGEIQTLNQELQYEYTKKHIGIVRED